MLRLRAEDADDLAVVSAAVQDALVQVADFVYDPRSRRFTAEMNRFRWEEAKGGAFSRVRSVLAFEGVLRVQSQKLRTGAPDAVAALLAVRFMPDAAPPGGVVEFTLAGGGAIRLEVEALDAVLADFGEPWRTPNRPKH
jgi:hypothetical protein